MQSNFWAFAVVIVVEFRICDCYRSLFFAVSRLLYTYHIHCPECLVSTRFDRLKPIPVAVTVLNDARAILINLFRLFR